MKNQKRIGGAIARKVNHKRTTRIGGGDGEIQLPPHKNQKRRRICDGDGGDGEIHLPVEIIQRIQSFLTGDEAARTTVLSKSWRSAWSTRTNLDFDQMKFGGCRYMLNTPQKKRYMFNRFSEITKKTLQRYEDLSLKVETLRLSMSSDPDPDPFEVPSINDINDVVSLANELIARSMNLGVVDLNLNLDLRLGISNNPCSYHFPDELLRSQTLTRLSLSGSGFTIDLRRTDFPNLRSLVLDHITVEAGDVVRDLISRLPLIEELKLTNLNLITSLSKQAGKDDSRQDEFKKLRYLGIGCFDQTDIFSRAIFHCLKKVVVNDLGYGSVSRKICSPTLELINIYLGEGKIWDAVFEVPNIRRFVFKGCPRSRLRFRSTATSKEWESVLHLRGPRSHPHLAAFDWFSRFNKLVKRMSARSRVSLHMYVTGCPDVYRYWGGKTPVESLTLYNQPSYFPDFLATLLLMCRPKLLIVTDDVHWRGYLRDYTNKIVADGLVDNVDFADSRHYLDDVSLCLSLSWLC